MRTLDCAGSFQMEEQSRSIVEKTQFLVQFDISVQLHHFRQYVLARKVIVEKICTAHQRADMFAKALPRDAFRYLRSTISGW